MNDRKPERNRESDRMREMKKTETSVKGKGSSELAFFSLADSVMSGAQCKLFALLYYLALSNPRVRN